MEDTPKNRAFVAGLMADIACVLPPPKQDTPDGQKRQIRKYQDALLQMLQDQEINKPVIEGDPPATIITAEEAGRHLIDAVVHIHNYFPKIAEIRDVYRSLGYRLAVDPTIPRDNSKRYSY